MIEEESMPAITDYATQVAVNLNADVILVNSPIHDGLAEALSLVLNRIPAPRENAFMILVTNGGDADAAYVIARDLQRRYKRVTVCISGDCFSAGSLVVLGAHEIVMGNRGRLGPLDVQILKKDEINERLSGLTLNIAMGEMRSQAFEAFEFFFWKLKGRFRSQISFRTAMDVAAKMSTDLYSEIYKQIDPVRIGEDARAMHIAEHYGDLLSRQSDNVKKQAIKRLLEGYPSHSCVIDREEAKSLFEKVRDVSLEEELLLIMLDAISAEAENDPREALALVLSECVKIDEEGNEESASENDGPNTGETAVCANGVLVGADEGLAEGVEGGNGSSN